MAAKSKYHILVISASIIAFATGVIFWNIARQEIYYLCGNFTQGFQESSVIRQLETANLSSYKQSTTEHGSRIVFSSKLNFDIHQCIIELDESSKVVRATYTQT